MGFLIFVKAKCGADINLINVEYLTSFSTTNHASSTVFQSFIYSRHSNPLFIIALTRASKMPICLIVM